MTDRWTNYRKCLYFLRFYNTSTHASSLMLMTSLKRWTLLGPVFSHFFLTKNNKSTIAKTYLALAAFSQNRILFLPSNSKLERWLHISWQDGCTGCQLVSSVPRSIHRHAQAFILYHKRIFVHLSEINTACHKLETVTSAQFTLYYIICTVF